MKNPRNALIFIPGNRLGFAGTLLRFEDIALTADETAAALLSDGVSEEQYQSLLRSFSEDEAIVIRNVRNALNFLDSRGASGVFADLGLFIELNGILAKDQALFPGVLRNGICSVPCIGEIPVPTVSEVSREIACLNRMDRHNYKRAAAECFCRLSRMQPFWDGNKRTAFFLCNLLLLGKGFDVMIIRNSVYADFDRLLTAFYTGENEDIISFLAGCCFFRNQAS